MSKILLAVHPHWFGLIIEPRVEEDLKSLGAERMDDFGWHQDMDYSDAERDAYAQRIADSGAEIVVTCWWTPKLDADRYKKCPNLKYLVNLSGYVSTIVDKAGIEAGLLVTNWGDAISRNVAEGALMLTLAALRKVATYQFHMHQRKGWKQEGTVCQSLFEKRVGLHGLGSIAQEYVKLLAPFGCRVEAYSPNAPDNVFDALGVHRQDDLQALYSGNEVISVHTALTPKTRGMVKADLLKAIPDGAVLVNTARGAVIDEAALVEELKTGRFHAGLDVFEEEPLSPDSPLRGLENVVLMPHEAGPTDDRKKDMGRVALANIKRYLAGEQPLHQISAERYDKMT